MKNENNNPDFNDYSFKRERGIVWVCDIKNSSKKLNSKRSVDNFEEYLKRFFWFSRIIINAAEGHYIKWTGDGFLAWFPCPKKRELDQITNTVIAAAYQMVFINNVTQLGISVDEHITLRNGIAFEEDALITKIETKNINGMDILGRNVVLAFRLSSFEHVFPNITIHGVLVSEKMKHYPSIKKIEIEKETIEKVFKGEEYEIDNLYSLDITNSNFTKSKKQLKENTEAIVNKIENKTSHDETNDIELVTRIQKSLKDGPKWSRDIMKEYNDFTTLLYRAIIEANGELINE